MLEQPYFGTWSEVQRPSENDGNLFDKKVDQIIAGGIDRRKFLTLAGISLAGLALSSCLPESVQSGQSQEQQDQTSEVPRRYATVGDWNAGAITVMGGQGYLAYEPNSNGFSLYTIYHVIEGYDPRSSVSTAIPITQSNYASLSGLTVGESVVRFRPYDDDPCVEYPLTQQEQQALISRYTIAPHLRMYDHPDLQRGAYVASPRYDLLEIEGRRSWTIYRVIDISDNDIYVTGWNGSLCHGRSGGPNILIEDPNYHDGKVVPILSKRARCIVVGISQSGIGYTNYEDQYGQSCYTDLTLSRPILAE